MKHHRIDTNDVILHVAELGEGPAVLFVHGFPDTWRGWRRQMEAVAGAGYRALALDNRGYGESSRPDDPARYTQFYSVGDLVGVLALLGVEHATLVGHDFGAATVWSAAMMRPDLFPAVFALSVPPLVPGGTSFLQQMRDQGLTDFYMFRQMRPEAEVEWADAAVSVPGMLYWTSGLAPADGRWDPVDPARGLVRPSPIGVPPFADADDVAAAVGEFTRHGFRGPLNYYRAIQPYFDEAGAFAGAPIRQPSFFTVGAVDGMQRLRAATEAGLRPTLPGLRGFVELPGVGHWPQLEATAVVNDALLGFLRSL
ncbi:epoxide hydrolase [Gemmatimonadetes bacterium T265]|nr:epoxide hydrolase [Gemmatimonadetes bacterium T265]